MWRYSIEVNKWMLLFFCLMIGSAFAQEPIPPPPLPSNSKGWLDMLIKMSPFIFGVIAPYGNDLMKTGMPKIFSKVPVPVLMVLSSIVSMIASATTAYVSGLAVDGQGGVTPEVAVVETGSTTVLAHGMAQKTPTVNVPDAPQPPVEPPVGGITLHK